MTPIETDVSITSVKYNDNNKIISSRSLWTSIQRYYLGFANKLTRYYKPFK